MAGMAVEIRPTIDQVGRWMAEFSRAEVSWAYQKSSDRLPITLVTPVMAVSPQVKLANGEIAARRAERRPQSAEPERRPTLASRTFVFWSTEIGSMPESGKLGAAVTHWRRSVSKDRGVHLELRS